MAEIKSEIRFLQGPQSRWDEFFEALTLTQTKKINQFPIIVFYRAYHKDLLEHIDWMRKEKTISNEDLSLILVTDSIDEALKFIKEQSIGKYGLIPERKRSPIKWLFEQT